jgi:hypothetical protein
MTTPTSSPIRDAIAAYKAGDQDWPATLAFLTEFDYRKPPPTPGDPLGQDGAQWWENVEDDAMLGPYPGTWGEVDDAQARGDLTPDEGWQVYAAVLRKHGHDVPDTPPPPAKVTINGPLPISDD